MSKPVWLISQENLRKTQEIVVVDTRKRDVRTGEYVSDKESS